MEQSFCAVNSSSASKKIPRPLWSPMVHYCFNVQHLSLSWAKLIQSKPSVLYIEGTALMNSDCHIQGYTTVLETEKTGAILHRPTLNRLRFYKNAMNSILLLLLLLTQRFVTRCVCYQLLWCWNLSLTNCAGCDRLPSHVWYLMLSSQLDMPDSYKWFPFIRVSPQNFCMHFCSPLKATRLAHPILPDLFPGTVLNEYSKSQRFSLCSHLQPPVTFSVSDPSAFRSSFSSNSCNCFMNA
jgi:hypothetical protein